MVQSFRPREAGDASFPDAFHDLVEFGLLASAREPFDPMEKAFHELGRACLAGTEHLRGPEWKLVHAYGLRPDLLAMSHVWQADDWQKEFVIAAKGAPEAIADLCHLSTEDRAALSMSVNAMATEGLRVLGVARASFVGNELAGIAARICVRVPRARRPGRSAARRACLLPWLNAGPPASAWS